MSYVRWKSTSKSLSLTKGMQVDLRTPEKHVLFYGTTFVDTEQEGLNALF